MTIKSIIVPFTGADCTTSLNAALSLAKTYNAHIEVLHAVPNPDSIVSDFLPEAGFMAAFSEFASEANRQLESALSVCTKTVGSAAVELLDSNEVVNAPSATFFTADGTLEQLLPQRARLSDLIIMNLDNKEQKASYGKLIRAALFRTGRPVLLLPANKQFRFPARRAVLAWNGSFEAARALRMSLPLLKDAQVHVYTGVEGEAPGISAKEAAVYLQRHGIKAEVREEFLNETSDGAIRRMVAAVGADLLVMGAYSRNDRLRETLLGSLTSQILKDTDIPVLMVN